MILFIQGYPKRFHSVFYKKSSVVIYFALVRTCTKNNNNNSNNTNSNNFNY